MDQSLELLCRVLRGDVSFQISPELEKTAIHHGVAGILHERLPASQSLRQYYQMQSLYWVALEKYIVSINALLTANDIDVIWFKGAILAQTIYPDPALRPMNDLDLFVPVEQCAVALELIKSLDFDFESADEFVRIADREVLPVDAHHYHLVDQKNNQIRVELHFNLLKNGENTYLLPEHLAWFETNSHPINLHGQTLVTFNDEAHLLYLCSHAMLQHGKAEFRLLRFLDIHCLIVKRAIDWEIIVDKAVELRWSYAVESALLITQDCFNTLIPYHVFEALRAKRQPDDLIEEVNRLSSDAAWLYRVQTSLKGKNPRSWLGLVMHQLFPHRAYMRSRYMIPAHRSVWPYYPYRWYSALNKLWKSILWKVRSRNL